MYERLEAFDREYVPAVGGWLAGIDEAGRGALAGPVVAAAVSLPWDAELLGVNDSKTLSEVEREALFARIVAKARCVGIAFCGPRVIDTDNILRATLRAMARAFHNLRSRPDVVLVDGRDAIDVPAPVVPVVGGDGKSLCVAAASIVAKVARDRLMRKLHERHPVYNFVSNKGYGTREHLAAIDRHGPVAAHRLSYRSFSVEKIPRLF